MFRKDILNEKRKEKKERKGKKKIKYLNLQQVIINK